NVQRKSCGGLDGIKGERRQQAGQRRLQILQTQTVILFADFAGQRDLRQQRGPGGDDLLLRLGQARFGGGQIAAARRGLGDQPVQRRRLKLLPPGGIGGLAQRQLLVRRHGGVTGAGVTGNILSLRRHEIRAEGTAAEQQRNR